MAGRSGSMQSGKYLFTRDHHVLILRRPRQAGKEQSEVDRGPLAPESSGPCGPPRGVPGGILCGVRLQ